MQVLVTGGTGFVGSQLVAALVRRGDTVRVLRRAASNLVALEGLPVEHCLGDLLDPVAVEAAVTGCDLVFHTGAVASYWRTPRTEVYRTNVDGTRTVLDACRRARVPRLVFTSSVAAIGIRPDGAPADEATSFDSLSTGFVYAHSKHQAEAEVQRAVAQGLDVVTVNPATVIGQGDHHLISGSMIVEIYRGHLPANPPGGMCTVDVDAVVQGHLAAAALGRTGERYILGGENLSHRAIAGIIAEVVGRRPPSLMIPRWALGPAAVAVDAFNRIVPRPPVVSGEQILLSGIDFYFDSSKAVRELNFPILPFRGAVEKAFHWYQAHGYL
ncbi:MAG TPA: SDR family oxidoreductase [Anaerolineae bacterium]